MRLEWRAFEKQQDSIKKMEEFVAKNIARASTTKRAQSRRKQLEKLERIERPLGDEKSRVFVFQLKKLQVISSYKSRTRVLGLTTTY